MLKKNHEFARNLKNVSNTSPRLIIHLKRGPFVPRHLPSVLHWNPEVQAYELSLHSFPDHSILPDSPIWFAWVEELPSFAFRGRTGVHYTVRKETMQRGGVYWYGYRSSQGRTLKRYIGKTTELTTTRLEHIALLLTNTANEALPKEDGLPINRPGSRDTPKPVLRSSLPVPWGPRWGPPRLATPLITRPHLMERLDDTILACSLTMLCAPAGYGKTTLIGQWVAERSARGTAPQLAWIMLDASDNDPARFWRALILACQTIHPGLGKHALEMLSNTLHPLDLDNVLAALLTSLAQSDQGGLLILEDYHVLAESRIHETVTSFLEHLPAKWHIALLTRWEPPFPLASWRARGYLFEIRREDLRFSLEEAALFFQQTLLHSPSPTAIQQLDTHLEGWAAGLRLLTLTLRGQLTSQEIESRLLAFADLERPFHEYFLAEIFQGQPEPVQQFLLQTSILDRLTGSLCDAVTDGQQSHFFLDVVARSGLFLEALDGSGQWYRYHSLWASALQAEAGRSFDTSTLRLYYSRASIWYEEHGMLRKAIEAALHAEEFPRMVTLIEQLVSLQPLHSRQELQTLSCWLKRVPEGTLTATPAFCFLSASVLFFGSLAEGVTPATLSQIEDLLQRAQQEWQGDYAGDIPGELLAFHATIIYRQGKEEQAVTEATEALARMANNDTRWRGLCLGIVGGQALRTGQLEQARQKYSEARAFWERSSNVQARRGTTLALGAVYFGQAELYLAEAHYRQALHEAQEHEDHLDMAAGHLGLARIFYAWNQLPQAEHAAHMAQEFGEQVADLEIQVQAQLFLARLEIARGENAQAKLRLIALLTRHSTLSPSDDGFLYRDVLLSQAQLQLANCELTLAQHSLDDLMRLNDQRFPTFREAVALSQVRLLLAQGEPQAALHVLTILLPDAQAEGRLRQTLEIQILLALANASQKHLPEARRLLHAVLAQASAQDDLRLFLDEGKAMANLLQSSLPSIHEKAYRAFLRRVLLAFSAVSSSSQAPLLEPLTPQEQRVLHLLASGHSNPEIARELTVSINTVKVQVQSIYRKLNAHNRVEASAIARLQGLM